MYLLRKELFVWWKFFLKKMNFFLQGGLPRKEQESPRSAARSSNRNRSPQGQWEAEWPGHASWRASSAGRNQILNLEEGKSSLHTYRTPYFRHEKISNFNQRFQLRTVKLQCWLSAKTQWKCRGHSVSPKNWATNKQHCCAWKTFSAFFIYFYWLSVH